MNMHSIRSFHTVKATKDGQTLNLYFTDYFVAYDTATELMGKGFVVKHPDWPTELFRTQGDAMATVEAFFR